MGDIKTFYQRAEVPCLDRLRNALDPKTSLFSRQIRKRVWESTLGTEEVTSTAICLIALFRSGVSPVRIDMNTVATLEALVEGARRHNYPGGAGLVIWANAVAGGVPLPELLRRLDISLEDPDFHVKQITTMEVAWLVSGLAHELRRDPSGGCGMVLEAAAAGLLSRFNPEAGLFHHCSEKAPLRHRLRRHLPNFADQIYPVQALCHAAVVIGLPSALKTAAACAAKLVALQGDLGQWWWHYNSQTGAVARPYPVYSVHQHAMAPMALMALTAAGGESFAAAIERSLAWISDNELGVDLLDVRAGTIWRDIEMKVGSPRRLARLAGSLLGSETAPGSVSAGDLIVNFETRPYEWGWCIFAGAMARGVEAARFVS
jgi:hypothetical protein